MQETTVDNFSLLIAAIFDLPAGSVVFDCRDSDDLAGIKKGDYVWTGDDLWQLRADGHLWAVA